MLDETIKEIQEMRKKRRELPKEKLTLNFEHRLQELKNNEPTSDNKFFRTNIIMYEFGDLCRSIDYVERFKNSNKTLFRDGFKDTKTILSEGKLAMADMITQLRMLCLSFEWDFDNLSELGIKHLEERQKDYIRDGWNEVNE